jgi:dynein heavy chain
MAIRGTILYFAIVDLANLDPMYQYSLQYFKTIFNLSMNQTPEFDNLNDRLNGLIETLTSLIFSNICRGLFEKHRTLFSFFISVQINKKENKIIEKEWEVF